MSALFCPRLAAGAFVLLCVPIFTACDPEPPRADAPEGTASVSLALSTPDVGDFTLIELEDLDGNTLFERRLESSDDFAIDLFLPPGTLRWTAGVYEADGVPLATDTGEQDIILGADNVIEINLDVETETDKAEIDLTLEVNQAPTLVAGGVYVEGLEVTALVEFEDPDVGPVQVALAGPPEVEAQRDEIEGFQALRVFSSPQTRPLFYVTAVGVDFPDHAATLETWAVTSVDDVYEAALLDDAQLDPAWSACQGECEAQYQACIAAGTEGGPDFVTLCAESYAACSQCPALVEEGTLAASEIAPRWTRNRCPVAASFPLRQDEGEVVPTFVLPSATENDFPNLDPETIAAVEQDPAPGTEYTAEDSFTLTINVLGAPDSEGNSPILDSCEVPSAVVDRTPPTVVMDLDFGELTFGGSPNATLTAEDLSTEVVETGYLVNGEACPDANEHVYEPGMVCIQAFAIDAAGNEGRSPVECAFVESRVPANVITDFIDDYTCTPPTTGPDGASTGAALEVQLQIFTFADSVVSAAQMMRHAEIEFLDASGNRIGSTVGSVEDDPGFPTGTEGAVVGSYTRDGSARYAFRVTADGTAEQAPTLPECPSQIVVRGFALADECVLDWRGTADVVGDGPIPDCTDCSGAQPLLNEDDITPGMTRPLVGANQNDAAVLSLCGIAGLSEAILGGAGSIAEAAKKAAEKAAAEAACWNTCDLRVTDKEQPKEPATDDPDAVVGNCIVSPAVVINPLIPLFQSSDAVATSSGGLVFGEASATNRCYVPGSIFEDAGTVTTQTTFTARIVCPGKAAGNCGECCSDGWDFMCRHQTEFRARAVAYNNGQATAAAALNVTGSCDPQQNQQGVTTDIQIVKGKVGGTFKGALKVDEEGKAVPTAEAEFNADFEWRYLDPDTAFSGKAFSSTKNPKFKVIKAENCETEFALQGGIELVHALALRPFLSSTSAEAEISDAQARLAVRARCGTDGPIPESLRWEFFGQIGESEGATPVQ